MWIDVSEKLTSPSSGCLMMETGSSSEISSTNIYQTTWCYIPAAIFILVSVITTVLTMIRIFCGLTTKKTRNDFDLDINFWSLPIFFSAASFVTVKVASTLWLSLLFIFTSINCKYAYQRQEVQTQGLMLQVYYS